MKYAAIGPIGALIYFDDEFSAASEVPADAVQLSDAQWKTCVDEPGKWTIINGVVSPIPDPTHAELLAQSQRDQVSEISASCQAAIYSGFSSSALGIPHTYPTSDRDQQNLTSAALASLMPSVVGNWVTPLQCAASTGGWFLVDHTAVQIQRVWQDWQEQLAANLRKTQDLTARIAAAISVADVRAIVWA